MKTLSWRLWFIAGLGILSLYMSAPTMIYFLQPKEIRNDAEEFQKALPKLFLKSHVKLGLDIQGGVQLILDVDTDSAVDNYLAKLSVEIKRWADEAFDNTVVTSSYHLSTQRRLVVETNFDEAAISYEDFTKQLLADYRELIVVDEDQNTGKITFAYTEDNVNRIGESALEQAERVIRSRVDKWGVADPLINRRQNGSILVQLPGFKDPERAKELLGRTAQLQFKIVDDSFTGFATITSSSIPEGITVAEAAVGNGRVFFGDDREQLSAFLSEYVPDDRRLLFEREYLAGTKTQWSSLVVMAATEITGSDIMDAYVGRGSGISSSPVVFLKFSALGSKRFADVTGANVGKRMAIVLDDVVESAPNIESKISGGEASITMGGGRSYEEIFTEAQQLALILKSGSVPATIKIIEERQVGSTLGPELAKKGIFGILLGLFGVLLYMVFYYFRPGLLACLVLTLNGLLLLTAMASFGFALTLPGIAGFILTLGMAVDANVLINERIRQEMAAYRNAKKSIAQAYKKVFWTIIDANFTTLIACTILLSTNSSGPIRGFAITLLIGLLISLFTSLYVTRILLETITAHKNDDQIRSWFKGPTKSTAPKLPFLKYAPKVSTAGLILIVAVIATTGVKGINWGVDFAGGTEVIIGFDAAVDGNDIRTAAASSGLNNVTIQALGADDKQYLVRYENVKDPARNADENTYEVTSSSGFVGFKRSLNTQLAKMNPEILQVDYVGPQVGSELRVQGLLSLIYAIIGILLYIALRFDMRFGTGAIVKMIFDVIIVLGFYVFFQRTFDLTSVAAFLTVLGYSVNDTIVIYDRIRENILQHPKKPLRELISSALNDTITRTLNTSITTLIALGGILLLATGQLWTFAMAIAIGIVSATISSLFIGSSFLLAYDKYTQRKLNSTPQSLPA